MKNILRYMVKVLLFLPRRFMNYVNHKRKVKRVFSKKRLELLRREILYYYSNLPQDKILHELWEAIDFLKHNSVDYFPCKLSKILSAKDVQLIFDKENGLNFSLVDGKRMYFKRGWTESECIEYCYCIQS